MHEQFPFSYTLIRSLSDDSGFARPDIGRFLIFFRCSCDLFERRNWIE